MSPPKIEMLGVTKGFDLFDIPYDLFSTHVPSHEWVNTRILPISSTHVPSHGWVNTRKLSISSDSKAWILFVLYLHTFFIMFIMAIELQKSMNPQISPPGLY